VGPKAQGSAPTTSRFERSPARDTSAAGRFTQTGHFNLLPTESMSRMMKRQAANDFMARDALVSQRRVRLWNCYVR
jgi:hypothetical protein